MLIICFHKQLLFPQTATWPFVSTTAGECKKPPAALCDLNLMYNVQHKRETKFPNYKVVDIFNYQLPT